LLSAFVFAIHLVLFNDLLLFIRGFRSFTPNPR
jgi:hypothetical protein